MDSALTEKLILWLVAMLGAGNISLLVYIWQSHTKTHEALDARFAQIDARLGALRSCIEQRYTAQQERRLMMQEDLVTLKGGQVTLAQWNKAFGDQFERAMTRSADMLEQMTLRIDRLYEQRNEAGDR